MSRDFYKIHFIGIGGIGISGLARLFLIGGKIFFKKFVGTGRRPVPTVMVTGSDLAQSEITQDLEKLGAEIFIGKHRKEHLFSIFFNEVGSSELASAASCSELKAPRVRKKFRTAPLEQVRNNGIPNLVIYSAAVPQDNPELKEARRLKIKCLTYGQVLGQLTKQMFTIAISGMHGKSTTAAMIALILQKAGLDPTAVIGTKLKEWQGANARAGKSKYLVIEADEWQASMLNYWPQIIVLTNIEEEHLDYYRNLDHIIKTFGEYISHLPRDGYLVVNGDDENIKKFFSPNNYHCEGGQPEAVGPKQSRGNKLITARLPRRPALLQKCGTPRNDNIKLFSLQQPEVKKLRQILRVPGEYNIANALAALAVARVLQIEDQISLKVLSDFRGTWRRFEEAQFKIKNLKLVLCKGRGLKIISDYAHHPTEIKATLKAARQKWPHKKIWVVFQPHQYQRTYFLFDKFVTAFDNADSLILMKIYDVAGRETNNLKKKINVKKLAAAIQKYDQTKGISRKVLTADSLAKVKQIILKNIQADNILIIMGAGDIYKLAENKFWS